MLNGVLLIGKTSMLDLLTLMTVVSKELYILVVTVPSEAPKPLVMKLLTLPLGDLKLPPSTPELPTILV